MAVNLSRLQSVLLTSGLQQSNPALYQVITQLIQAVIQGLAETNETISGGGSGSLSNQHYLTHSNDLVALPQSRQLLAGTGISFDDSVFGERTVNNDVPDRTWSVLTNGDPDNPEPIYDSNGDVIMTHSP